MKYHVRRNEQTKKSNEQQIITWNMKQTHRDIEWKKENFNHDSHENNEFSKIFYDEAEIAIPILCIRNRNTEETTKFKWRRKKKTNERRKNESNITHSQREHFSFVKLKFETGLVRSVYNSVQCAIAIVYYQSKCACHVHETTNHHIRFQRNDISNLVTKSQKFFNLNSFSLNSDYAVLSVYALCTWQHHAQKFRSNEKWHLKKK